MSHTALADPPKLNLELKEKVRMPTDRSLRSRQEGENQDGEGELKTTCCLEGVASRVRSTCRFFSGA